MFSIEPKVGIGPTSILYESTVLPLNYIGKLKLEPLIGIEPMTSSFTSTSFSPKSLVYRRGRLYLTHIFQCSVPCQSFGRLLSPRSYPLVWTLTVIRASLFRFQNKGLFTLTNDVLYQLSYNGILNFTQTRFTVIPTKTATTAYVDNRLFSQHFQLFKKIKKLFWIY